MLDFLKNWTIYDTEMNAFFAGILTCLFVVSLIQFNLNKDTFFLFFSLFLLSLFISLEFIARVKAFNYFFVALAFLFYILSIDQALLLSKDRRFWRRFSTHITLYTTVYLLIITTIELAALDHKYLTERIFTLCTIVIVAVILFQNRNFSTNVFLKFIYLAIVVIGVGLILNYLVIGRNQISFTLYIAVIIAIFLTIAPRMGLVYKTRLFKAEYNALKAQMNPHFLGNSFNSIINLVEKEENDKAVHYLTTLYGLFQKMIKKSDSDSGLVPLHQELEICQKYLELEALRFEDDFSYEIHCEDSMNRNFQIPPLLLQPLLENAILHGLRPKLGEKKVSLTIHQNLRKIICIIDDNGVGRQPQPNIGLITENRSPMGIQNVRERLELFSKLYQIKNQILINDKRNSDETNAGTTVTLEFNLSNTSLVSSKK
jgi:hypothetical protein